jgi:uncharacterized RmlC-like cupin family protein
MKTALKHKFGCVVSGAASYVSKQGSEYIPGISNETVGSQVLFLGMVTIPPEGRTRAHIHPYHESAFYMLSGDVVELWTGNALEQQEKAYPGDYLYIPAGIPHVAVNRSNVPAVFIGVRDEPTAQESVEMHPELDARVP